MSIKEALENLRKKGKASLAWWLERLPMPKTAKAISNRLQRYPFLRGRPLVVGTDYRRDPLTGSIRRRFPKPRMKKKQRRALNRLAREEARLAAEKAEGEKSL